MSQKIRIGLVGDFRGLRSENSQGHPLALAMAAEDAGCDVACEWLSTLSLAQNVAYAGQFDGLWLTPASPYDSIAGALNIITLARESGIPFLGTCGGLQHVLIEYARNVLHIEEACHRRVEPRRFSLVRYTARLLPTRRKRPHLLQTSTRISRI